MLAIMTITGRNQNPSKSDPACLLGCWSLIMMVTSIAFPTCSIAVYTEHFEAQLLTLSCVFQNPVKHVGAGGFRAGPTGGEEQGEGRGGRQAQEKP